MATRRGATTGTRPTTSRRKTATKVVKSAAKLGAAGYATRLRFRGERAATNAQVATVKSDARWVGGKMAKTRAGKWASKKAAPHVTTARVAGSAYKLGAKSKVNSVKRKARGAAKSAANKINKPVGSRYMKKGYGGPAKAPGKFRTGASSASKSIKGKVGGARKAAGGAAWSVKSSSARGKASKASSSASSKIRSSKARGFASKTSSAAASKVRSSKARGFVSKKASSAQRKIASSAVRGKLSKASSRVGKSGAFKHVSGNKGKYAAGAAVAAGAVVAYKKRKQIKAGAKKVAGKVRRGRR